MLYTSCKIVEKGPIWELIVGLSDTTVLAIYRDILKVSISRYLVINYRDNKIHYLYITVIKNPFVMQY